jgi:hypothetical protein
LREGILIRPDILTCKPWCVLRARAFCCPEALCPHAPPSKEIAAAMNPIPAVEVSAPRSGERQQAGSASIAESKMNDPD